MKTIAVCLSWCCTCICYSSEHYSFSEQTAAVYLFSHGIVNDHTQAFDYQNDTPILGKNLVTFDYADAQSHWYTFYKIRQSAIGQNKDIRQLKKTYLKLITPYKKRFSPPIILFGVSRGAATAINFMGSHRPPHIKALILESPFAHVSHVARHLAQRPYFKWIPGITFMQPYILNALFPYYQTYGLNPYTMISTIDKKIPILLICSQEDGVVPYTSTLFLYKKLCESGHKNVHILIVPTGDHAQLLKGAAGNHYYTVVHAFYKKYNLPHDRQAAQQGHALFSRCKP